MTFEEYWIHLMKVKPIKEDQQVLLSKAQFKNMLQKSFTKGFYQALSCVKENKMNDKSNSSNIFEELLKLFKQF